MMVHPVTFEIAQLAGRIEGEQAARGVSIAFEDLLIGTTALHLGYSVATLNVRHFPINSRPFRGPTLNERRPNAVLSLACFLSINIQNYDVPV